MKQDFINFIVNQTNGRIRFILFFSVFMLLFIPMSQAQDIKLSGEVTDVTGESLTGVAVLEKGTSNGTITDINGKYQLSVSSGSTLSFSYIGYITQDVIVGNQTQINIQLEEDIKSLEEVVVIGYGVQRKSSVTGAISQIKSDEMANRSISRPEQALQGKTAGVHVIQTSGSPGANPLIRVRGISSNGTSDPLFVVDGLRTENISSIDPNNIETMEVLKDAASAAIYGAEAGNGVILITTKKGSSGSSKFNYEYQFVSQNLARIPEVLNAKEYITYMNEGGILVQSDIEANWDGITDTRWIDIAFENSLSHKHNLSFEGGNNNGTFFLALTYLGNDGIVKGESDLYQRITGTINVDYKIKPWLKVGTNNVLEKSSVKSVSENSEYGSLLAAVMVLDPLTADVYDANKLPVRMQNLINNGYTLLQNESGQYYGLSAFLSTEQVHPMIIRDATQYQNGRYNIMGSVFSDLTPFKGLSITSRLGYSLSLSETLSFGNDYYANARVKSDFLDISSSMNNIFYYQWENFANYNTKINEHDITAMVGMSFSERKYNYVTGSVNDLIKDDPLFGYLDFKTGAATQTVSGQETKTTKLSYFGRLSYDYNSRYFLQASLRADAADLSVLPKEQRWGYFPAISAGWLVSNESFFEGLGNTIPYLKLRASWGQNGSIAGLSGYLWSNSIASNQIYPFTDNVEYNIASRPGTLGNTGLKWETSTQMDIGLDARFLKDRLTFTFDYFNKKTTDLIVTGATPSLIIGNTASPINAGDVVNKGFEFELGWRDKIRDFSYGIRGNLATLKNEVTFLHSSITRINGVGFHTTGGITAFEVGYPVWYYRGYKLDYIDQATGNPVFKDLDGNGVIADADRTMIGSALPDFTYGITINAAYKGFDLIVFGTGSQGNDIFNCLSRPDYPSTNKLKVFYDERWTSTNTNALRPRPNSNGEDKYWVSDALVFDGSYFKIKQIQIGYSLPKNLLKKATIGNIRIYGSIDDFFTFTKYPGFDPEASAGTYSSMGVDKGSYPTSRKVVLGANISF